MAFLSLLPPQPSPASSTTSKTFKPSSRRPHRLVDLLPPNPFSSKPTGAREEGGGMGVDLRGRGGARARPPGGARQSWQKLRERERGVEEERVQAWACACEREIKQPACIKSLPHKNGSIRRCDRHESTRSYASYSLRPETKVVLGLV